MRLHSAIPHVLRDIGVTTVFGVMGDANILIISAAVEEYGIRYVAAANELGAVLMAKGHAQASGDLGVATITHGPALTNTATALVEAVRARAPLLLIAGDTAPDDGENLQNIEQRDIVVACGAGFESVGSGAMAGSKIRRAIRRAFIESRPIVLDVPVDALRTDLDEAALRMRGQALPRAADARALAPRREEADAAVRLISRAERPLVLAGGGAVAPEARAALLALAERIGAGLATTLKAKDLFTGERGNVGLFGGLSSGPGAFAINRSDCVIAFGASMNKFTTNAGDLLAGKAVVQIDVDPMSLGLNSLVDLAVISDAENAARAIIGALDAVEFRAGTFRDELDQATTEIGVGFTDRSGADTIDIRTALLALDSALPADRRLVVDSGRFMLETLKLFSVPDPSAYIHTANFGSVGLGMGTAVGVSFMDDGRPTVLVCGDGGFMLNGVAEFNTAVRYGRDLVCVILNDGSYGAEYVQLVDLGKSPALSLFEWPEFAAVADALGGHGHTMRSVDDVAAIEAAVGRRSGPVLIDVKLDPAKSPGTTSMR